MPGLLRLLRPHQWVKNFFVLTGVLFGHAWGNAAIVRQVLAAAAAFCLVASGGYIFNDVLDAERDRAHPTKRHRPIAAGTVPVRRALALGLVCWLGGLGLGWHASPAVLVILLLYSGLTASYSMGLKQVVILDAFIVSAGFMLRILAGTVGVGIPPSRWLLLCGFMVTLFLGFAKRRSEVARAEETGSVPVRDGEGYTAELLDKMIVIAAACTILSYGLYTMSPETMRTHRTENLIYTVPFVVYGIFRYIFLLQRGRAGGDASRELFEDPHLLLAVLMWLATTLILIG